MPDQPNSQPNVPPEHWSIELPFDSSEWMGREPPTYEEGPDPDDEFSDQGPAEDAE